MKVLKIRRKIDRNNSDSELNESMNQNSVCVMKK